MAYSFENQFKPDKSNLVADALSRKTVGDVEFGTMISIPGVDWIDLQKEILADTVVQQIVRDLHTQSKDHAGFQMVGERLLYKGRVVIPQRSHFKKIIMEEYH